MNANHFLVSLDELRFVLWELFRTEEILGTVPYAGHDRAHYDRVLEQGLAFAREIGESYQRADQDGCALGADGQVRIPRDFAALWRRWDDWGALGAQDRAGGDKLMPPLVKQLLMEMMMGANPAFMCYGGFTVPATELVREHASPLQKRLFLGALESFRWDACYCATEPQAGSDLLAIEARAVEAEGGVWHLRADKRFITAGMHGLTENTLYIVLARPESSAADSMFLSCYLVPRLWINPDSGEVSDNNVDCVAVPEKMGLRGCPNTHLSFGARGPTRAWLLGDRRNAALLQFHSLARHARINSSLFALGLAACSTYASVEYARRRVQGRPLGQPSAPHSAIITHADVRRMLLEMKARVEGMRGIVANISWLGMQAALERRREQPDPERIEMCRRVVDLLVPVSKAHSADEAWRVCELGIQVHGGVGYTTDAAVEQYARDVKILSIWEGTAYVQSLILVRDVFVYGRNLRSLDLLEAWIAERRASLPMPPELERHCLALQEALDACRAALGRVHVACQAGQLDAISAHFVTINRMFGQTLAAWALLESASAALRARASADTEGRPTPAFLNGKVKAMEYFFVIELPSVRQWLHQINLDEAAGLSIGTDEFAYPSVSVSLP